MVSFDKSNKIYIGIKRNKNQIDKDHEKRIAQLRDTLRTEKEEISKLENFKKEQKTEYDEAMKELNKIDGEYRSLRDQKLNQKIVPKASEEQFEKDEELNSLIQKNKVLARIAENKVTQLKVKIQTQKRK